MDFKTRFNQEWIDEQIEKPYLDTVMNYRNVAMKNCKMEEELKNCRDEIFQWEGMDAMRNSELESVKNNLSDCREWMGNQGHNQDCQRVLYEFDKEFSCTCGLDKLLGKKKIKT